MTEEQIEILEATCHPQAVYPKIEPQEAVALLRELQGIYCGTKYCKAVSYAINNIKTISKNKTVNKEPYRFVTPSRFSEYNGGKKLLNRFYTKKQK